MPNNEQPTVRSGDKLELFDGSNDHNMHSRSFWNKLIAVANAVLRTNQWNVTDGGIFFKNTGSPGQTIIPGAFYNITNTAAAAAATWKTYQFRDFLVGGRSKYSTFPKFSSAIGPGNIQDTGNGELKQIVQNDLAGRHGNYFAQPAALATQTVLNSLSDTVIYDASYDGSTFGQIVLNDTITDLVGTINAAFWLEITDDPVDGWFVTLKGRMYDPNGTGGRQTAPFPDVSQNIIPLTVIAANATLAAPLITPIQTGNLINRIPPGTTNHRGAWTADALVNQIFYTGDLVLDDTLTRFVVSGISFYTLYQYTANYGKETVSPNSNAGNWKEVGIIAYN